MSLQRNGSARCEREAVAHVVEVHGVSQRRACRVLAVDRSSVRYRGVRPDDAEARAAMKAVAAERRRFGYRRIHVMLERQGIVMNLKKLRRLYREEKLQVRRRGGRKRALGTRRPMLVPEAPNMRWSLDFVSDALTDGRRFRVLAVVDDYSRERLALVADTSLSGHRVVRELESLIARRGHLPWLFPTMAPSSPPWPSWHGARALASTGTTSRPASPCETRLRRELQRPVPRRAAQRDAVLVAHRRTLANQSLGGLQHHRPHSGLGARGSGTSRQPSSWQRTAWQYAPRSARHQPADPP